MKKKDKSKMRQISIGIHQAKCLSLLLTGKTVEQTAEILKVHPRTVDFQVQRLLVMIQD